jgi:hypothetical protein
MAVRRTGGTFTGRDPTRSDWPIYFLASSPNVLKNLWHKQERPVYRHLLCAVNELRDGDLESLEAAAGAGVEWFIDSGVFNLSTRHARAHGVSMDTALGLAPEEIDGFDELFARYVGIVRRLEGKVWGYIEVDQGGRENKIRTRARLEAMGLSPIPVYHPLNDGWDYFDYLAERYDRICFGNVVMADQRTRARLVATAWERKRRYPHLWIHLLGYTPNERLNAYPIDSADSSSWLTMIRWSKAHKERAMLKTHGDGLPLDMRYRLGDGEGAAKTYQMSAMSFDADVRNWRNHLRAVEGLGFDLLPPPEAPR